MNFVFQLFGLRGPFRRRRGQAGDPPALSNSNSTITATGGAPPPPVLTNDNSQITAEAA